jgi:hypothetical protein
MWMSVQMERGSKPSWSFFKVPWPSLAVQTARVWAGKVAHGWPLILKNSFRLVQRFFFGRMPISRRKGSE